MGLLYDIFTKIGIFTSIAGDVKFSDLWPLTSDQAWPKIVHLYMSDWKRLMGSKSLEVRFITFFLSWTNCTHSCPVGEPFSPGPGLPQIPHVNYNAREVCGTDSAFVGDFISNYILINKTKQIFNSCVQYTRPLTSENYIITWRVIR